MVLTDPAEEVAPAVPHVVFVEAAFPDHVADGFPVHGFSGVAVRPAFLYLPVVDVPVYPWEAGAGLILGEEGIFEVEPGGGDAASLVSLIAFRQLGGIGKEDAVYMGNAVKDGGREADVEGTAMVQDDGFPVFIQGFGGVGRIVEPVPEPGEEGFGPGLRPLLLRQAGGLAVGGQEVVPRVPGAGENGLLLRRQGEGGTLHDGIGVFRIVPQGEGDVRIKRVKGAAVMCGGFKLAGLCRQNP